MARLSSANTSTPPASATRSSSTDEASQLVGQLSSDGTAHLQEDSTQAQSTSSNPPKSLKAALSAASGLRRHSNTSTESSNEEDYDALTHDPGAVVAGGKGGGYAGEYNGSFTPEQKRYEEVKTSKSRPGPTRLKSIPVTLNKLKEKGRYVLTADDEALKEILKLGIERVRYFLLLRFGQCSHFRRKETPPQQRKSAANLVNRYSADNSQLSIA